MDQYWALLLAKFGVDRINKYKVGDLVMIKPRVSIEIAARYLDFHTRPWRVKKIKETSHDDIPRQLLTIACDQPFENGDFVEIELTEDSVDNDPVWLLPILAKGARDDTDG